MGQKRVILNTYTLCTYTDDVILSQSIESVFVDLLYIVFKLQNKDWPT